VSSPAPAGGSRPTVKDRATCRSTPRLAPCLGFSLTPATRSGAGRDITRGGRCWGITRSGKLLGMTRNTAGFSLDLPFCGLRNLQSLRTFGAPRRRRQHVHPGIPMPRTRVARPHTRRRATRRSPLSLGQRRRTPPSRLRTSRYPIFPGHDGSALHAAPATQATDASVHLPQRQFMQIGDSDVASDLRS
jgi:hypothetical protein